MPEQLPCVYLLLSCGDLETELMQLEEEGRQTGIIRRSIEKLMSLGDEQLLLPENQIQAGKILDLAQQLPLREDYPFEEPDDLDSIRGLRPSGPRWYKPLGDRKAGRRIHGAWLGRCAGCLLGKPVEGVKADQLWGYLKASRQWPLSDYIRANPRSKAVKEYPDMAKRGWAPRAEAMPVDDDTNYTTLGVMLIEEQGIDFTPCAVATFWMRHLPMFATFTAERVAYRNFAMSIAPPLSASYRNPYREWIGAQIRADGPAYVALGRPELAAELAWRDASISHVKNGIYGEMFVAAMIAAAPFAPDLPALLEAGLSEIPRTSRLHARIREVLDWQQEGIDYDQAVARIHEQWDDHRGHHWCHTLSNAMVCAVALLWSDEDFGLGICRAVQAGFDTDCNGATVGSILGMRLGPEGIEGRWVDRLNDTLYTALEGRNVVKISRIAGQTANLYRSFKTPAKRPKR
jgi:ADP-ribosylglycohydrolase